MSCCASSALRGSSPVSHSRPRRRTRALQLIISHSTTYCLPCKDLGYHAEMIADSAKVRVRQRLLQQLYCSRCSGKILYTASPHARADGLARE